MTKLVPLGDNVIVHPIEAETMTKSGIVIPDTANKEKPMRGKVLSVGPGKTDDNGKLVPIGVKEGDIVVFTKYAPTEIKIDGVELYILSSSSLLAIEVAAKK
jgi:chaperonin GroES